MKEKGSSPHWHIHGTWKSDRKAYKEYEHKGRVTLPSGHLSRPVRVSFDKDTKGFQYCCKADPPNVVRKWHITDEQVDEWHRKSDEHNASTRATIKRALAEEEPLQDPELYYRALKRRAYQHTVDEGKLIHPAQLKSHVVTYMFASNNEQYKSYVLAKH